MMKKGAEKIWWTNDLFSARENLGSAANSFSQKSHTRWILSWFQLYQVIIFIFLCVIKHECVYIYETECVIECM